MVKLLANRSYLWVGFIGAKLTAIAGMASAMRKKDIGGMDADDWFHLSSLYMLFIVAALLARMIVDRERPAS